MTERPSTVVVTPEVAARDPEYVVAVLVVEGIPNGPSDDASRRALRDAEAHLKWPACKSERLVVGNA